MSKKEENRVDGEQRLFKMSKKKKVLTCDKEDIVK